jgi:hypothetical protein
LAIFNNLLGDILPQLPAKEKGIRIRALMEALKNVGTPITSESAFLSSLSWVSGALPDLKQTYPLPAVIADPDLSGSE